MTATTFTAAPWSGVGCSAIAAGRGVDSATGCEIDAGGVGIDKANGYEGLIEAAPDLLAAVAISYQAGALAFRASLLEIERAHGTNVAQVQPAPFGVATALPILRSAFDLHASGEHAAGFWDALAYWIAQPFDGCLLSDAEGWNVLRDLALEEDYERAFSSGTGVAL